MRGGCKRQDNTAHPGKLVYRRNSLTRCSVRHRDGRFSRLLRFESLQGSIDTTGHVFHSAWQRWTAVGFSGSFQNEKPGQLLASTVEDKNPFVSQFPESVILEVISGPVTPSANERIEIIF